tara:strand:- start:2560 stop:3378 length:819 start_codon:yes stop_codon:yes gene_type:complete
MQVHGVGQVAFSGGDDPRLSRLYQHDPVRILFPRPAQNDLPLAVFVTTSGGLVGGDRLELSVRSEAATSVMITAQAAEKIYRSNGADSTIEVTLTCDADAWLEWLPQETIVFDGARLVRKTNVNITSGGRMLAGEFLVLGRTAMGETVMEGLVRDEWVVRLDGKLVWADALRLSGDINEKVQHPAGFGGAVSIATAVYIADDAPDYLNLARELLSIGNVNVRTAASVVNGILLVRFLSSNTLATRNDFGVFWAGFRSAVVNLPNLLPRIWHI